MANPKTPSSTGTSYLSPDDFLKRTDVRTVGQLCSDVEGTVVSPTALLTDPNLNACLMDACGDLESAAFIGEKYTMGDLAALTANPTAATNKMFRIIRDLTLAYLIERRPNTGVAIPEGVERSIGRAQAWLEQLAQGVRIFGFVETAKAGHLHDHTETYFEVTKRNGLVVQAERFMGIRSDRACGGPRGPFA